MAIIIAFPILAVLLMFQSVIFSRINLLHGSVDLILLALIAWALQKRVRTHWHWSIIAGLMVSFISAVPFGAWLIGYLLTVGVSVLMRQRVWQTPILAMFTATFLGTLITQTICFLALKITGSPLPLIEALNIVLLPSILLNLLFAIPLYALFGDLARLLYPENIEV